jgi:hypothetical protein
MSEAAKKQAEVKVKPLSKCTFLAFFQKIWRWWLGVWYGFSEKKPKLAAIIYKIFFFVVFSEGVTIVQILILIFLPQLLGLELAGTEFMIPKVQITIGEFSYYWSFIGNDIAYDSAGNVIIGGGLGYFIAFKTATFLAQCINFPLQRNITYKSKGNPVWQAMWYFIGWVLINLACDAINNLWLPIANHFLPTWVSSILAMVAQGGIAMVIFFFIFMVIFPDLKKASETADKKVESLKAKGATKEEIAAAELKATEAKEAYRLDEARKNVIATESTANSKATVWQAVKARAEKLKAANAAAEEISTAEKLVEEKYADALDAAQKRDDAITENEAVIAEVAKARAARA